MINNRFAVLCALLVCVASTDIRAAEEAKEETPDVSLGYALGMDVADSLKRQDIDIDADDFVQGFTDAFVTGETRIDEDQKRALIMKMRESMQAKQMKKQAEAGETNMKEGETFLKENAEKEGVTVLPSGLQYTVLEEGSGDQPAATDTVTVHYTGTLIDGTVFDSSVERGSPATFALNRVIPGWTEGVQLMKPGAKYRFFIPSDLAYGERGAPPTIGPNATLIFDVELLEVK